MCDAHLAELQKQTYLLEKFLEIMRDWKSQDEDYHEKTLDKLD